MVVGVERTSHQFVNQVVRHAVVVRVEGDVRVDVDSGARPFAQVETLRRERNHRGLVHWAMVPLSEPERRDFWEICEDRYQVRSTILTSQLAVSRWHEQIGDPTVADGILRRLVHNPHRIEMRGGSMRKNRGKANT